MPPQLDQSASDHYPAFCMDTDKSGTVQSAEVEGLSQTVFTALLVIVAFIAFVIAVVLASNPLARDPAILSWKSAILIEVTLAVGTSIVSSLAIYWFYSRVVEKRMLDVVTARAAEVAAKRAASLYENRFERMMPTEVYSATATPKPEFENHLERVLHDSRIYWFKGDDGGYTVYRLNSLTDHHHLLQKEIILLLLDPTDEYLLRERSKIELANASPGFSKEDLDARIVQLRKGIFASVVAIFDNSHRARVEVGFHKEHLFFRSEIFDKGIFLTYYLGGEFPATCFYPSKTLTYQACIENFRQINKSAVPIFSFSTADTDEDLKKKLQELGCPYELADLRSFLAALFTKYSNLRT
jgi:hypothetical protein